MPEFGLFLVSIVVFAFAIVAKRLSTTMVTAPMVFLALGGGLALTGWFDRGAVGESLHIVAEVSLIVLLFFDASQTDLKALKKHHLWPKRMLLIGLPLAVVIGTIAASMFLPDWPWFALALIAALLAPTDAAFGQSVISNKDVPERVRRGLTVESGLNDGLALPIILLFASLTGEAVDGDARNWIMFGLGQVVLGPLAGLFVGFAGAKLMMLASDREWTAPIFEGISSLAVAGAAYLLAGEIGGNGFIATFIAGLTFGNMVRGRFDFVFEFTDGEGQLLMWAAFFMLGLGLLPEAIGELTLWMFAFIMVSLLIVRPVSIWLSLLWTDTSYPTRLFFGWFGPRGLATALFALLILPQIGGTYAQTIMAVAINAVWISALLHGASAAPLGKWFGRIMQREDMEAEHRTMPPPFDRRTNPDETYGLKPSTTPSDSADDDGRGPDPES